MVFGAGDVAEGAVGLVGLVEAVVVGVAADEAGLVPMFMPTPTPGKPIVL